VTFRAQEETENIYASIDGVMEKVDTQIRRYKEKLKDRKHHHRDMLSGIEENPETDVEEEDEDSETELQIVKVNKFAPKPLTAQEAAMQIVLSGDDFLMFSNSQTDQVNVVYRRKDGSYGWIEPEFVE
jgi:putative sigma-54 modulation protein